jgi:hypothetical protein
MVPAFFSALMEVGAAAALDPAIPIAAVKTPTAIGGVTRRTKLVRSVVMGEDLVLEVGGERRKV